MITSTFGPKIIEKKTYESDQHDIIYTLKLEAHTYFHEGDNILEVLQKEKENFDSLNPTEQVKRFLEIIFTYSEDTELEMESYIDAHKRLVTSLKFEEKKKGE